MTADHRTFIDTPGTSTTTLTPYTSTVTNTYEQPIYRTDATASLVIEDVRGGDHANTINLHGSAQKLVTAVTKDKKNPFHQSRYASLSAVIEATRGPLAESGLFVCTMPAGYSDSTMWVVTRLVHTSGQILESKFGLPISKSDPQAALGALTYARRYAIISWLNLVVEDDDGEQASGRLSAVTAPVKAPAQTEKSIEEAFATVTDKAGFDLLTESCRNTATDSIRTARAAAKKRLGI